MGPYEKAIEDISNILGDLDYDYTDENLKEDIFCMCIYEYGEAMVELYSKCREIKKILRNIGGVS